jgi:hypothetical protein
VDPLLPVVALLDEVPVDAVIDSPPHAVSMSAPESQGA